MPLCACGCSRSTSSPRAVFATYRCRWRTDKRRARSQQQSADVDELDLVVCAVCQKSLVRNARTATKRYHDACRPVARKLLRYARESA